MLAIDLFSITDYFQFIIITAKTSINNNEFLSTGNKFMQERHLGRTRIYLYFMRVLHLRGTTATQNRIQKVM